MQGYNFLVEKALGEQTGNIRIDMTAYGFTVESEHPMNMGGGGGCSGCGSGGSSGCGG